MSLRESIIAQKAKKKTITPSYLDGKEVEIRVMSVGERRDFLKSSNDEDGNQDAALLEAAIIIECVYDPETGKRVFEPTDRDTLVSLPAPILDELAEPCLEINGLLVNSVDAALKNLKATRAS